MRTLFGSTGRRIRVLRGDFDMSQSELAAAASKTGVYVSQSALSRYESDETIPPSNALAAVARALGTTADYLLLLSDDPNPPNADDQPALGERRERYTTDEQEILALWRALDSDQRAYVRQTLELIQRASTPRIIGDDQA